EPTESAAATANAASSPVATPASSITATPASSITATPASEYGAYPANYKEIVTAWMQKNQRANGAIDWQTEPKPADLPSANGQHHYGYLVIFNTVNRGKPKTRSVLIHD